MSAPRGERDAADLTTVAGTGLLGLLAIQAFVGYEWLMSGLAKLVRGGFPAGLADELREKSIESPSWYRNFLEEVVIPNGRVFGELVQAGELLIGALLIGSALLWWLRWPELGVGGRRLLLVTVIVASAGGVLLNVSFHLANGGTHPWLIPREGFDEGVDLDSLMPLIEIVLAAVSARVLWVLRSEPRRRTSA